MPHAGVIDFQLVCNIEWIVFSYLQDDGRHDTEDDVSLAPTSFYPSRPLKREVSLDEDGYPCMLSDKPPSHNGPKPLDASRAAKAMPDEPAQGSVQKSNASVTWTKKPKVSASPEDKHVFACLGHDDAFLDQLTADMVKPHDEEEPASKKLADVVSKPVSVSKAASAAKPRSVAKQAKQGIASECVATKGQNRKLGIVRYHPAQAQSYITHELPNSAGKKTLVVAVSEKQSSDHKAMCYQIYNAILAKNLDKPAAVAMRSRLLSA